MVHPFISRLRHAGGLSGSDEDRLGAIISRGEQVDAHQQLVREGDRPDALYIVTEGMACRYKMLSEGKRSIVGLLLPGDSSNTSMASDRTMDHSISTLSRCELVKLPRHALRTMMGISPRVAEALLWAALVEEGTLREWLVRTSQRPAAQGMAHFFCEMLIRLQAVERAEGNSFDLPLAQADLADALGISAVHVNRMLQELRGAELVQFFSKHIEILDVERLKAFAQFTPGYLRLNERIEARLG